MTFCKGSQFSVGFNKGYRTPGGDQPAVIMLIIFDINVLFFYLVANN